uniref:Uncharacterized protein n=1 Tax=Latimeria chalumnae TaxID=7897 RepID=H3ATF8_LATCH
EEASQGQLQKRRRRKRRCQDSESDNKCNVPAESQKLSPLQDATQSRDTDSIEISKNKKRKLKKKRHKEKLRAAGLTSKSVAVQFTYQPVEGVGSDNDDDTEKKTAEVLDFLQATLETYYTEIMFIVEYAGGREREKKSRHFQPNPTYVTELDFEIARSHYSRTFPVSIRSEDVGNIWGYGCDKQMGADTDRHESPRHIAGKSTNRKGNKYRIVHIYKHTHFVQCSTDSFLQKYYVFQILDRVSATGTSVTPETIHLVLKHLENHSMPSSDVALLHQLKSLVLLQDIERLKSALEEFQDHSVMPPVISSFLLFFFFNW